MTTTIPLPTPDRARSRGFTLVEVMIGATISSFILLAVMTSFLFMGRSGANIQNYNDMEAQARTALELFAEDTRQASAITWITKDEIYLTVNAVQIYYYYVAADKTFYRKETTGGTPRELVTGITNFNFSAYTITGTTLALDSATALATAGRSTKQLQISLEAARSNQTVVDATNTVLSARFILRNKRVTA